MTLPGAPNLQRVNAALQLDGLALDALAHEYGTPLFVYSQRSMLDALAAYRHVAGCDTCRDYAAAAPARFAVPTVVSATLAHHDAGHRGDTLSTATQHFALDD